jgi:hypothetical protein
MIVYCLVWTIVYCLVFIWYTIKIRRIKPVIPRNIFSSKGVEKENLWESCYIKLSLVKLGWELMRVESWFIKLEFDCLWTRISTNIHTLFHTIQVSAERVFYFSLKTGYYQEFVVLTVITQERNIVHSVCSIYALCWQFLQHWKEINWSDKMSGT